MARDDARSCDRVVLAIVCVEAHGVRDAWRRCPQRINAVDRVYVVHDREVLCDDVDVSRSSSRRTSTA